MTARVLGAFKQRIREWTLIPAQGGCFEVTVDGQLIYSKLATRRFPDETQILEAVRQLLEGRTPTPQG